MSPGSPGSPGSPVDPAVFFAALDVAGAPRELVALGGSLDPPTLAAAYRAGCFPWPPSGRSAGALERSARRLARTGRVPVLAGTDGLVPWCSPEPRAVLLPEQLHVPRSLRRRLRTCGWSTTVDTAFREVVAGCADRTETWITPRMREAYTALHEQSGARAGPAPAGGAAAGAVPVRAHSVEVWDGDRLVAGLYGVLVGQVFSGESMFTRVPDASKAALVDLVDRMREGGVLLLDTQQESEHLARMGQVLVSRRDFVRAVCALRDRSGRLPVDRRPVARLAGASDRAPEQDQPAVVG